VNRPVRPDIVLRATAVPVFVAVTPAPGKAAPVLSSTVPEMEPVGLWARAPGTERSWDANAAAQARPARNADSVIFFLSSSTDLCLELSFRFIRSRVG